MTVSLVAQATANGGSDLWRPLLLSVLPSIAGGVVIALVSVRLALRRFRAERWWERKVQAYTDLFGALFHVRRYCRETVRSLEEGVRFTEEYKVELNKNSSAGFTEIRKAAAMGAFLFSVETAQCLERLETALDDPHYNEDPSEEFSAYVAAVESTIKDLRPLAKRDLALP